MLISENVLSVHKTHLYKSRTDFCQKSQSVRTPAELAIRHSP